ncbi:programmed cell death protein 10-A-like isoform X1 [Oscarella lobularis]|uniref:programmed cell death protein 10-A-like isoform X1 n=1 Tax=Oscarella lobularis TaxID=121494 RepID=UPI0033133A63
MDEEAMVASLALHVVVLPTLDQLEQPRSIAAAQTLRSAFNKVERANPGLTQDFLAGILDAEKTSINLVESLLRLSCEEVDVYTLDRPEAEFVQLNRKANGLKRILSRIPQEINDRSRFLQTIKDIAGAIKELLDAVNVVSKAQQASEKMKEYKKVSKFKVLEQNKKSFVKHSKSFSDTLKRYFKDGKSDNVFLSANRLINQTNALLRIFKAASVDI